MLKQMGIPTLAVVPVLPRVGCALDAISAGLSQSQPGMLTALSPRKDALVAILAAVAWMPICDPSPCRRGWEVRRAPASAQFEGVRCMDMEAVNAGRGTRPSPAGRRLRTIHNVFSRGLASGVLLSVRVLLPLMPVLGLVLSRMGGVR